MTVVLPPLVDHLAAIKRRLLTVAVTVAVWFALTFAYATELIAWFRRPLADELTFYGPTEALFASIKVSLLAGVVLSLPVILYQFWKFIEPALLPREQRWAIPLFSLAAALFGLGLVFCNLVILPLVIQFFVGFGMDRELMPQLAVGAYIDFNVKFLLIFGFAFELPLVLTLLSRVGVVSPEILGRYRKHAIMVALIISAIITPDATMVTMLLMAIPLIVLYEVGILGARLFGRRKPSGGPGTTIEGAAPAGTAGHRVAVYLLPFALFGVAGHLLAGDRSGTRHELAVGESPPPAAPSIQALAVARDQSVYAGSFGMGVFRSQDRGRSWAPASADLPDRFILCLAAARDGSIYAGTFRAGVFRSRDEGKSWEPINGGLKRLEIKALLIEGGVIYAGTGDGVYRVEEGDDRWRVVSKGLDETLVHSLVMAPERTLFAGTSGRGVFRHKPPATEWTRLAHGLVDHEGLVENFIRVLALDKDQALYAGTFDGGVFRSGDGGQTWQPISRALPNDSIRGIVANERGLFVATGRGVFKSLNQGRRWTPLNNGLTELSIQVLIASADGSLYAGTSSGVFRSDDDGEHWVGVSAGLGEAGASGAP